MRLRKNHHLQKVENGDARVPRVNAENGARHLNHPGKVGRPHRRLRYQCNRLAGKQLQLLVIDPLLRSCDGNGKHSVRVCQIGARRSAPKASRQPREHRLTRAQTLIFFGIAGRARLRPHKLGPHGASRVRPRNRRRGQVLNEMRHKRRRSHGLACGLERKHQRRHPRRAPRHLRVADDQREGRGDALAHKLVRVSGVREQARKHDRAGLGTAPAQLLKQHVRELHAAEVGERRRKARRIDRRLQEERYEVREAPRVAVKHGEAHGRHPVVDRVVVGAVKHLSQERCQVRPARLLLRPRPVLHAAYQTRQHLGRGALAVRERARTQLLDVRAHDGQRVVLKVAEEPKEHLRVRLVEARVALLPALLVEEHEQAIERRPVPQCGEDRAVHRIQGTLAVLLPRRRLLHAASAGGEDSVCERSELPGGLRVSRWVRRLRRHAHATRAVRIPEQPAVMKRVPSLVVLVDKVARGVLFLRPGQRRRVVRIPVVG
eukprot:Opistho-1_new@86433